MEVLSPRSFHRDSPAARDLEGRNLTAVLLIVEAAPIAVLGLDDTVRAGTDAVVRGIAAHTSGPPALLTGDTRGAAQRLAAQIGITDVRANLLPDGKVAAVRSLSAEGHRVLFVGDGINDAPAMASAHTSIAMGRNGADLSLDTADAITVRDELGTIPAVLALARRPPRRGGQPSPRGGLHHRTRGVGSHRSATVAARRRRSRKLDDHFRPEWVVPAARARLGLTAIVSIASSIGR